MDWISSSQQPQDNEIVEAIGSFKCNATWNTEKNSWDLPENEQIQAQVVWYRKLDAKKDQGSPQCCET